MWSDATCGITVAGSELYHGTSRTSETTEPPVKATRRRDRRAAAHDDADSTHERGLKRETDAPIEGAQGTGSLPQVGY